MGTLFILFGILLVDLFPICSMITSALFNRAWNVATFGVLAWWIGVERTGVLIVDVDFADDEWVCCCGWKGIDATGRREFYTKENTQMIDIICYLTFVSADE